VDQENLLENHFLIKINLDLLKFKSLLIIIRKIGILKALENPRHKIARKIENVIFLCLKTENLLEKFYHTLKDLVENCVKKYRKKSNFHFSVENLHSE
jgi:hypothetical protein